MKALTKKREDYIDWDTYFMGVAFLSAQRSKDPNTQVGACIVNSQNRIVGIGYNGMARGCSDDIFPWCRNGPSNDPLESKYLYVCHAELNAVLNKISTNLEECRIYVPLFPCNECAKVIIQAGITEVIYISDKYEYKTEIKASKRMFSASNIKLRQFTPTKSRLFVDFKSIDR